MIRTLSVEDAAAVTDVLCDAFSEYPVMRYVLGPDMADYGKGLARMIHFFVMARLLRGEPVIGVGPEGRLEGVALVSFTSGSESPATLLELREEVWNELGADVRARYEGFGEASAFQIDEPHIHLNMIGVRREVAGSGLGRRLLQHVHEMSAQDPGSRGVSLTTEKPENIRLYEHFGYHMIGRRRVSGSLETWGFFRPDDQ
jgi:GNAT superfamily N-acetyltransferase